LVVAAVGIVFAMLRDFVTAIGNRGMYHVFWNHPILMTAPLTETMIEKPRMNMIGLMMYFCCVWCPFKSDTTLDGCSLYIINLGGVESLRMESIRKALFHKTGITQNGKTQNGKTQNWKTRKHVPTRITQNGITQEGKTLKG
jgi:hypothetical protein